VAGQWIEIEQFLIPVIRGRGAPAGTYAVILTITAFFYTVNGHTEALAEFPEYRGRVPNVAEGTFPYVPCL
jgi:hypothetical protein